MAPYDAEGSIIFESDREDVTLLAVRHSKGAKLELDIDPTLAWDDFLAQFSAGFVPAPAKGTACYDQWIALAHLFLNIQLSIQRISDYPGVSDRRTDSIVEALQAQRTNYRAAYDALKLCQDPQTVDVVTVVGIEVTQATQRWQTAAFTDNSIPLVQGKPTAVRVYTSYAGSGTVKATIAVTGSGISLSGQLRLPSNPNGSIQSITAGQIDRGNIDHSLNFLFLASESIGTITGVITVWIDGVPATQSSVSLTTVPAQPNHGVVFAAGMKALKLHFFCIPTEGFPTPMLQESYFFEAIGSVYQFIQSAYPIAAADLTITSEPYVLSGSILDPDAAGALFQDIQARRSAATVPANSNLVYVALVQGLAGPFDPRGLASSNVALFFAPDVSAPQPDNGAHWISRALGIPLQDCGGPSNQLPASLTKINWLDSDPDSKWVWALATIAGPVGGPKHLHHREHSLNILSAEPAPRIKSVPDANSAPFNASSAVTLEVLTLFSNGMECRTSTAIGGIGEYPLPSVPNCGTFNPSWTSSSTPMPDVLTSAAFAATTVFRKFELTGGGATVSFVNPIRVEYYGNSRFYLNKNINGITTQLDLQSQMYAPGGMIYLPDTPLSSYSIEATASSYSCPKNNGSSPHTAGDLVTYGTQESGSDTSSLLDVTLFVKADQIPAPVPISNPLLPGGKIVEYGFDVFNYLVVDPSATFDLSTVCPKRWVSPSTYAALRNI